MQNVDVVYVECVKIHNSRGQGQFHNGPYKE